MRNKYIHACVSTCSFVSWFLTCTAYKWDPLFLNLSVPLMRISNMKRFPTPALDRFLARVLTLRPTLCSFQLPLGFNLHSLHTRLPVSPQQRRRKAGHVKSLPKGYHNTWMVLVKMPSSVGIRTWLFLHRAIAAMLAFHEVIMGGGIKANNCHWFLRPQMTFQVTQG